MSNNNFTDLSKTITKKINNSIKRKNGIFFTPQSIIKKNLEIIKNIDIEIIDILEPSCGSCEFINVLDNIFDNVNITGIEYMELIFNSIKNLSYKNKFIAFNDNYITWNADKKYDLIIGNPPYYVMKKDTVDAMYYQYFDGRPNIFILFIIKSLSLLKNNGILSFILPSNFLNCLYYDKVRRLINNNYKIIDIQACDDDNYLNTAQNTIIFIIQNNNNTENNKTYSLNMNGYTIFNTPDKIKKLNTLYVNSTNLHQLNFDVNIGNIIWNQCKDILTDDSRMTRLIYNSDIINGKISLHKYNNNAKKNFIHKDGINKRCIIVNRGYGTGKYTFDYCLLDVEYNYLLENHIINIRYNGDDNEEEIYQKIINSFKNNKTQEFIDLYFKNNAINTTEFKYIFPIFMNSDKTK